MWQRIEAMLENSSWEISIPHIYITDIIEILIIAYIVYRIMVWIKNTKAWMLLKGITALAGFILVAAIFKMQTILWLAEKSVNVLAIAGVVVFQPELRRALEKLGEHNFITSIVPFAQTKDEERFSNETIDGIVTAAFEMGKVKTGALIVVEQAIMLTEYEHTGIELDSVVSSQLLINIFEHNTPLHDGAVIIRGNRIAAATCYLPLSDNTKLSKALGTRHRAAVGMSEVSDALIIAVSEETGKVSAALGGQLVRDITPEYLTERLIYIQNKIVDTKRFALWKGRQKHEGKND